MFTAEFIVRLTRAIFFPISAIAVAAKQYLTLLSATLLLIGYAAAESANESTSAPAKKSATFDIWEYQLEGNTLLSKTAIEKALYPYLGPAKSIEDVQQAADNLERIYRDSGYPAIAVNIPEQDVVAGIVKLKVIEGKIGRVTVRGARYFTLSGIRAATPALETGQPLAAADVQREIMTLNARSGDLRVAPVLKPGVNQGDVDVELRVKDTLPVHGGVEYNNFNSVDTTRSRVRATLSYDNLWQAAHSFGLTYQVAPEKTSELNVISASYAIPLAADWRMAAYAVKSNTNVKSSVDASVGGNSLSVLGDGEVAGLRFIHSLPASTSYTHGVILGADYKHFNQQIEDQEQPIRYMLWSAQYNGTLIGEKSLTSFNLGANFGIRGLVNDDDEFAAKRNAGHANFLFIDGGITRTDTLPRDFQFLSRLRWQLAQAALIDNEQFSIGGFSSVRGYYESQVLGDNGYSAGVELRSPSAPWFGTRVNDFRALVFYDIGEVRVKNALSEQDVHNNLEAIGAGVRLQVFQNLRFLWDIAYPFKDAGKVDQGDWRSYVRANWDF